MNETPILNHRLASELGPWIVNALQAVGVKARFGNNGSSSDAKDGENKAGVEGDREGEDEEEPETLSLFLRSVGDHTTTIRKHLVRMCLSSGSFQKKVLKLTEEQKADFIHCIKHSGAPRSWHLAWYEDVVAETWSGGHVPPKQRGPHLAQAEKDDRLDYVAPWGSTWESLGSFKLNVGYVGLSACKTPRPKRARTESSTKHGKNLTKGDQKLNSSAHAHQQDNQAKKTPASGRKGKRRKISDAAVGKKKGDTG